MACAGPPLMTSATIPDAKFDRANANLAETNKEGYRKLLDDPSTPPDRKERIKKALGQFDELTKRFRRQLSRPSDRDVRT